MVTCQACCASLCIMAVDMTLCNDTGWNETDTYLGYSQHVLLKK
jgi:hypothetical protein